MQSYPSYYSFIAFGQCALMTFNRSGSISTVVNFGLGKASSYASLIVGCSFHAGIGCTSLPQRWFNVLYGTRSTRKASSALAFSLWFIRASSVRGVTTTLFGPSLYTFTYRFIIVNARLEDYGVKPHAYSPTKLNHLFCCCESP